MMVIDWELSLKLAGNDINHAKTYLILLSNDLNARIEKLTHSMNDHRYDNMKSEIHQIIGALSYCGAIRLKKAAEDLHAALKAQLNIDEALILFCNEAKLLADFIPLLNKE